MLGVRAWRWNLTWMLAVVMACLSAVASARTHRQNTHVDTEVTLMRTGVQIPPPPPFALHPSLLASLGATGGKPPAIWTKRWPKGVPHVNSQSTPLNTQRNSLAETQRSQRDAFVSKKRLREPFFRRVPRQEAVTLRFLAQTLRFWVLERGRETEISTEFSEYLRLCLSQPSFLTRRAKLCCSYRSPDSASAQNPCQTSIAHSTSIFST